MGTFRFGKDLPAEVSDTTSKLESSFHTVFEQMILFRDELINHSGKAARSLYDNLEKQIKFFSQATFILMSFADSVKGFLMAVEATDAGSGASTVSIGTRASRQYQYSAANAEDEIKLNPESLEQATNSFESNLKLFETILTDYHGMLDSIIADTKFPWEAVDEIWPDAKEHVRFIVTEFQERVSGLLKDSHNLIKELQRVDNLISAQILQMVNNSIDNWAEKLRAKAD
ncbi:hypothetical protein P5G51_006890 [Virgibacillus sp. 179-BFC.A HS]|uniref:LXG domain-containing protein n=1 Tax=Tigheibacillus jepli TaxID=3035914 RepID=A0ABU5CH53_9BACI|nr:hypothetical protein [Virgibacillus sp. 179-BFC.A HS]MDY0405164.1 hypothetical protein [Virgibacillus sp. 179-BFC.A HS]